MPNTVEYLVVGGGGGGGFGQLSNEGSGGGGAGGLRTGSQTATTTTYPISIGTGGSGGLYPAAVYTSQAFTGRHSQFGSPTQTYMRSEGGGCGVSYPKGTGDAVLKTSKYIKDKYKETQVESLPEIRIYNGGVSEVFKEKVIKLYIETEADKDNNNNNIIDSEIKLFFENGSKIRHGWDYFQLLYINEVILE